MAELISKKYPLAVAVDRLLMGVFTDLDAFLVALHSELSSNGAEIEDIFIVTTYDKPAGIGWTADNFNMIKDGAKYNYRLENALKDIISKNPSDLVMHIHLYDYEVITVSSPPYRVDPSRGMDSINKPIGRFVQRSYR
jgi:hypothetical protein